MQDLKKRKENLMTHQDIDDDDDDDGLLFQPIPPKEDCPICSLPLPIDKNESEYKQCCGIFICDSCGDEDIRASIERG